MANMSAKGWHEYETAQLLQLFSDAEKRTPETLREIYRSLVESAGDSIYLVDKDCRYIFVNRTHLNRLGLTLKHVVGRPYGDFHGKEQEKEFKDKVEEVFATGRQAWHEHKSGRDQKYFLRTFSPVKYPLSGRIIGVTVVSKDITYLRLAEEALRESEERYRGIIENMDEGYHEMDLSGSLTFFNESIRKITGYSGEELKGMSYRQCAADEENSKKVFQAHEKIAGTGKSIEWLEWDIIRKDGVRRTIAISASLISDRKGQPAGFRGIVRDITERKQAEEALRVAEELYRTLATSSKIAIYIVQDGKMRFTNPYLPEYSGYTKEDLLGMDILNFVHPEDRRMVKEKSVRMLKGESKTPYEYRIIDKNGKIRWIVETVSSITYEGKRATLGSTMDITEHKEMEKQLEEARRMLIQSEKLAALGKLSAGVAHEILNPLNVISIRMQWMETSENFSDNARESLKICREQIERIARITRGMSQFSRATAKHVSRMDINRIIQHILSFTAPRLKLENIATDLHLGQDLPLIMLDKSRMEQVFMNLINNAIDAMHSNEEKILRVATMVEAREEKEILRVALSDSGTGVRPEDLSRIFEPFFTTKSPGKGTGLGLSICYGIVQDHGGRIWAENNERGGTTFFIELPAARDGGKKIPSKKEGTVGKILVVDDEEQVVATLKDFLMERGYEVYTATDGRTAIEKVKEEKPHVVLLDILMPGMSGLDTLKEIKKMDPQIGVIMATAVADEELARRSLQLGAYDYITKPFDLTYVETVVMVKIAEVMA